MSAGRSRNAHCLQANIHTAPQVIRLAGRFFKAALRRTKDAAKASQSFAAAAAKESPIIFFGDMCGEENTSRPANVRAVRPRRTARALQSGRKSFCQKSTTFLTATTPQAIACGVASAWPRFIAPEAGLAPSGSPAALSHNSAATDSLQNSDNPAGRSLRGCLSMTPQTRRSIFLNRDAGELRLGQITPTALPSSRQTAS